MTPYTEASRALAARLRAGEHALTNQDLRQIYGISRVTTKARMRAAFRPRRGHRHQPVG